MLLADKVCVIVGVSSSRGIGFATVGLFREHGATVAALDVQLDAASLTAMNGAGDGAKVTGYRCDITNRQECQEAIGKVLEVYGRIDCLVNCAGVVEARSLLAIDESSFDKLMEVNLKGTFNVCQSVLEPFSVQRSGSLVNVSSVSAQRGGGIIGGAHYAASKGGVISLTKSIAREFAPVGVRANVVCPSAIETGMLDGHSSPKKLQELISQVPLARLGRPRDVAGACLFLASDLSSYVTGATLDVNGGSHIH